MAVDDPYNMCFTPSGRSATVVAETLKRLDFRDPHTMMLQASLAVPKCAGINHGDLSIDSRYLIMTTYDIKPLSCDPKKLKGLSEKLVREARR